MMLGDLSETTLLLKQTLLDRGPAERVDLASQVNQVIDLINQSDSYDLIVVNLLDIWEQGIQLTFWLDEQSISCPVVLVLPSESPALALKAPFIALPAPLSLPDFVEGVWAALQPANHSQPLQGTMEDNNRAIGPARCINLN